LNKIRNQFTVKLRGIFGMKMLNITIADSAHCKLDQIKQAKRFANNAEAFEFLISEAHKALFGVKGGEL
jgi:hypothetical protein